MDETGNNRPNNYECTIGLDQELADAAAYAPGRRCVCTQQVAVVAYRAEFPRTVGLYPALQLMKLAQLPQQ